MHLLAAARFYEQFLLSLLLRARPRRREVSVNIFFVPVPFLCGCLPGWVRDVVVVSVLFFSLAGPGPEWRARPRNLEARGICPRTSIDFSPPRHAQRFPPRCRQQGFTLNPKSSCVGCRGWWARPRKRRARSTRARSANESARKATGHPKP